MALAKWIAASGDENGPTVRKACACADVVTETLENKKGTSKKQEPMVKSTSRRGARAAYHNEYPRPRLRPAGP